MDRKAKLRGRSRAHLADLAEDLYAVLPRDNLLEPVGVRVGAFQCLFLVAVILLGHEAYGVRIFHWLKDKLEKEVNLGQVYNAANRVLDSKLVASREVPAPSGVGRTVIVYELTPYGLVVLEGILAQLKARPHE